MRVALVLASLAACGPGDVHVTLAPVPVIGTCGRPAGAHVIKVSALGDFPTDTRAFDVSAPIDVTGFRPETRQLTVEVLGPGGTPAAIGATAPLQLGGLAEGSTIPIAMAPLDGFCQVGPMGAARDRPLVARAGDGAIVVGGQTAQGPVNSAEYYDPATGAFTPITLPSGLSMGFVGASATTLPDGRAVIAGGPNDVFLVFDPATRALRIGALLQVRAFHAAVAIGPSEVLLAGGCGVLTATGACAAGSERLSTRLVDVDKNDVTDGPALVTARIGGQAVLEATGADLTGDPGVLLAGGVDLAGKPVTTIERFAPMPGAPGATASAGPGGLVAPLASGGVLVALASPGAPAAGGAAVIAPGAAAHTVGATTARAGAALVPLEDGTVAAIGGASGTSVDRYLPAIAGWRARAAGDGSDAPAGLAGAAAVRLDDGTVLVVGGHDASGAALPNAWLYRPALKGPFDGAAIATPIDEESDAELVPLDPAKVTTTSGDWQLASAGDGLGSWAVVAGPAIVAGTIEATVRPTGGVAVLVGFVDPSHFDAIVLPAGGAARLERHTPGAVTPLCTGQVVPATIGAGASVTIDVVRKADRVSATVTPQGGAPASVIDCAAGTGARGLVGIAPAGPTADLIVDTVSVSR